MEKQFNSPPQAVGHNAAVDRIGYTTGVFDMFHIGHLNVLRNAKLRCDKLIVGVTTDELTEKLKSRRPIIPFDERIEIVRSIRFVDEVVAEEVDDKILAAKLLNFNLIFKGDDWKGTEKWNQLEAGLKALDVEVIYLPSTHGTSSTLIRSILEEHNLPETIS